jgi:alkylation response protein AidB-like acyl-CoA dehydrogenase
MNLALKYSQERKALERNFKHQAIAFKLADMATQIMAAKMLCLKAACEKIRELILLSQVLWQIICFSNSYGYNN